MTQYEQLQIIAKHPCVDLQVGRSAGFRGGPADDAPQPRAAAQAGGSGSLLRSGRGLRLGLGAVTRTATGSTKGRGPGPGQRSTLVFSQPVQPVSPATSQKSQDNAGKYNIQVETVSPQPHSMFQILFQQLQNVRHSRAILSFVFVFFPALQPRAVAGLFPPSNWLEMKAAH